MNADESDGEIIPGVEYKRTGLFILITFKYLGVIILMDTGLSLTTFFYVTTVQYNLVSTDSVQYSTTLFLQTRLSR